MDDFFKKFNEVEWRTYNTYCAYHFFELYWKESEELIKNEANIAEVLEGPKWQPQSDEEYAEFSSEKRVARTLHDEIMTPMFRYFTVVGLFMVFEREIRRFLDNVSKEKNEKISYKDLKGSLLEQAAVYIESFLGFKVQNLSGWSGICDLQKVRNCIVHQYGEASKDQKHLLTFGKNNSGVEANADRPMEISEKFIELSLTANRSFFLDLFEKVKWKVNEEWQK